MAWYKLVILFMIVNLMNFVITKAQDDDFRWESSCSGNKTTPNSAFQRNLRTLLSYLSSNATTGNKELYKTSVASRNHSDTVYGMFACWGNVPPNLCKQCVANATPSNVFKYPLESDCYLSKEVLISSDECLVRYSYNRSFVSAVDFTPSSGDCTPANVSKQARLIKHLLISETIKEAATNGGNKYYATKQARISAFGFQSLFCEAQCTPDLSPQDCRNCLNVTVTDIQQADCGQHSLSANSQSASCRIRYDVYPFYRPTTGSAPPPGLIPSTNSVSNYLQRSSYLSHNCTYSRETNTAFLSNLRTLLSYLSSNATTKTGFFKTTVTGTNPSDTVNGLFMCRGDISPSLCQLCVLNATERISLECSASKEAIIWYDNCLLRYSDRSSLSDVDTDPSFHDFTIANTSSSSNLNQQQQSFFTWILADALYKELGDTGDSTIKNYRTRSVKLNDHQTIYTLAQCTPDLQNCYTCLQNIFEKAIPWCCLASPEGKVLYPSCFMMFGLSKFYSDGDQAQPYGLPRSPSPTSTTAENKKRRSTKTTMLIVIPIVCAVLLSCCCCYCLLRRKARKSNYKTLLKKVFGEESTTLESLQYSLATIKAATNNFSQDNKIGKGGFGEVYKGILSDGRYIAVKRLSISSKQGSIEFKNEILLIAKLQHRNLVTLIGFCLEEQEKILIYEYMPNGSLDYLLFDTQRQKLSWAERYKIIGGTALGILYLHEYSRLKVIHRDLKPSNVLLDEKMNPKLSDFGMARMVEMDQDRGNTNRIAGTYGYMSPEYAMLGQFSEKSDVFSFGVMILEIITGKRSTNSYESHNIVEGLVSYVWRQWKNQTPLNLLDPSMKGNYSEIEVIKCIQIGLLCVQENPDARPTMATIISYFGTHTQELPSPQEPAFFSHNRMHRGRVAQELQGLGQLTYGSTPLIPHSLNEMSISKFYPR